MDIVYRDFHYADGYKAGIKTVVDWLKENSWDDDGVQLFIPTDWQDQVKEWGIDEKETR